MHPLLDEARLLHRPAQLAGQLEVIAQPAAVGARKHKGTAQLLGSLDGLTHEGLDSGHQGHADFDPCLLSPAGQHASLEVDVTHAETQEVGLGEPAVEGHREERPVLRLEGPQDERHLFGANEVSLLLGAHLHPDGAIDGVGAQPPTRARRFFVGRAEEGTQVSAGLRREALVLLDAEEVVDVGDAYVGQAHGADRMVAEVLLHGALDAVVGGLALEAYLDPALERCEHGAPSVRCRQRFEPLRLAVSAMLKLQ
ncbi:MAG: hypothetical protein Q8L14_20275 [Myxococcales bacterium]|nr:hypothetical protein [Myxococcales bacterium]